MASAAAPSGRIVSLDQFRGYTVAGMFLVNFLGSFTVCPFVLAHHHTYCSYADTIMPHFLFAVGFSFRLTFGRRVASQGATPAYFRMVRRLLGLVLVSLVVYNLGSKPANTWGELVDLGVWDVIKDPLKRHWFQTLMHIAVTSLWILPVIRARAGVRILFMMGSAILHVWLSYKFNYAWTNGMGESPTGIDGGPLGFLTWTTPAIVGTLACDAVACEKPRVMKMVFWSIVLMALGWVFSCGTRFYDVPATVTDEKVLNEQHAENPVIPSKEQREQKDGSDWRSLVAEPPFVPPPGSAPEPTEPATGTTSERLKRWFLVPPGPGPPELDQRHRKRNYWMMSQRSGSISYLTFCAGLSVIVYVLFHLVCDRLGWQLGFFRTFGTNAIVGYILHEMVGGAVKPFVPEDAPVWYVFAALLLFFQVTYMFVRHLEKQGIYVRV